MAHPELWANHVVEFLREIGDTPSKIGTTK
jgi:hypothetical protein